ncbi:MAG TPA: hypothetical protein VLH35_06970 [Candidatus Acidoferrales bacterium]|nr:hypothetical protein [Candidatus Acidoferrales bacterium]
MSKVCAVAFSLVFTVCLLSVTAAYSGVAVHSGDWIEYAVTVTGNPAAEYNVTWGRIDVTAVEGSKITVDVQTQFANGTLLPEPNIVLDVATGAIGDGFFIPTEIQVGDIYSTQYEGNITIAGTQTISAGGAQRTVFYGTASGTTYYWDKDTRIMVKAVSELPDCTMYTETKTTNLWRPQIFGIDINVFYAVIAVAVAALVAVVLVGVFLRLPQRHKNLQLQSNSRVYCGFI